MDSFNISQLLLNSVVTTGQSNQLDYQTPFSFIEFVSNINTDITNTDALRLYIEYTKLWEATKKEKLQVGVNDLRTQLVNFLRELKLQYTTTEEKRYFDNIDLSSDEDLEIIIPFFARKIKEICAYFADKRKNIHREINMFKSKGTKQSVQDLVKDTLVRIFKENKSKYNLDSSISADTISRMVKVDVEDMYYTDIEQNNSTNTNPISGVFFIDTERTLKTLINEKQITLEEIPLIINIESTDLNYFDIKDTIENTDPTRDNLKYLTQMELVKRFIGTDFYYISTNSTADSLSGKLFTADTPYHNLLNIDAPNTITQIDSQSISERKVGLFFKPTYEGVIKLKSRFIQNVDYSKLESDKIYIFPDPKNHYSDTAPLVFTLDNTSVYRNIFNNTTSLPLVGSNDQPPFPYSSTAQRNFVPNVTGKFQGITDLSNQGDLYSYQTDIFGNEYFTFVDDTYFYPEVDPEEFNQFHVDTVNNNYTTFSENINKTIKASIASRQLRYKQYYVKDITTQVVSPLSEVLKDVLAKVSANAELTEQLENEIVEFTLFSDVYFLRTKNYVIIDKLSYDGKIIATDNIPNIIRYNNIPGVDQIPSYVSTPYRVGNELIYSVVDIQDPTNILKYVTLSIYKYNLTTGERRIVIDHSTTNLTTYRDIFTFTDIETNIISIKQSVLTYNSKSDTFFLLSNYTDLNLTPHLHFLTFKITSNEVIIITNQLYVVANTNITSSGYDAASFSEWEIQTLVSTPEIDTDNGTFLL